MTPESAVDQIEKVFGNLPEDLKNDWCRVSRIIQQKKGEILVQMDERSRKLWFVIEGGVRAYYIKEGRKICDWFAFENEFICALNSFYSDEPSMHQIDLLSDTVLLEMNRSDVEMLSEKYHLFERIGRLSATETMLRLQKRIVSLQFESAQQRLENLMRQQPEIDQRVSLGDIASYIGISQETLSRVRAQPGANLT